MTRSVLRIVDFLTKTLVLTAVAIGLVQHLEAQTDPTNDETQIREVTRAYYYEFEKPSLDGQFALWSPRSKDDSSNREMMTKAFNNYWDKIKVEKFEIERVKVNGDKAEVRLIINLHVVSKRDGKPVGGWFNRDFHATHRLEKENGKWLLMEQIPTSEAVADELINAGTDRERRAIAETGNIISDRDGVIQYAGKALDLATIEHDYERAIQNLKFAAELAEKEGDQRLLANIYSYLAVAYEYMGDYGLALLADLRYKELSEQDGYAGGVANALNSLTGDYTDLGQYDRALESIKAAMEVKIDGKAPVDRSPRLLSNLANAYLHVGDYDKAVENYTLAAEYAEKNNLDYWIATAYKGLAASLRQKGELTRADEFAVKALNLAETSERVKRDNGLVMEIMAQSAEISLALKKYDVAAALAQRAITAARSVKYDDLLWRPELSQARALLGMNKPEQARKSLEEAIATIEESGKKSLGGEDNVQSVMAERAEPYKVMSALNAAQGNALAALSFADRARARVLLATMSGGRTSASQVMTAEERKTERELSARLADLNKAIQRASVEPNADKQKVAALEKSVDAVRSEYEIFRNKVIAAHPQLRLQIGDVPSLDLPSLESVVPDNRSAIAEYLISDDGSYIFLISRDGSQKIQVRTVALASVDPKGLKNDIEAYRRSLAAGDLSFQQQSRGLYDTLIKPIEAELAGKTNIAFVPDSAMWDLPIAALQNSRGQYLIERAAVSYAPSVSVLKQMNAKVRTISTSRTTSELVAFGNPLAGAETQKRVQQVFMDEKLEPLPEAERLVNTLAKMYGPARSKVYVGPAAREEVAKAEAPKYRIVQFATHGILNDVSPMYSHLVLAQDPKDANEDGLLEAWELKDMNLNADMVILSACDTARGRISSGEGIIGMTWAAFIAGAPTTVASQWKVESSSTTELMIEFHRQLLTGKVSKAEALRRAQLKLMRDPKYKHPSYWAAWVLVGDGS